MTTSKEKLQPDTEVTLALYDRPGRFRKVLQKLHKLDKRLTLQGLMVLTEVAYNGGTETIQDNADKTGLPRMTYVRHMEHFMGVSDKAIANNAPALLQLGDHPAPEHWRSKVVSFTPKGQKYWHEIEEILWGKRVYKG